jgi:hypothetical protein
LSKIIGGHNKSDSEGVENAAVAGLLRTIQRPLSTIGRIFSDDASSGTAPPAAASASIAQSQPPATPRPPARTSENKTAAGSAEDAAARQASQEAEEARKIRLREEEHVVETLSGMFPGLDKDVVADVVRANEGR